MATAGRGPSGGRSAEAPPSSAVGRGCRQPDRGSPRAAGYRGRSGRTGNPRHPAPIAWSPVTDPPPTPPPPHGVGIGNTPPEGRTHQEADVYTPPNPCPGATTSTQPHTSGEGRATQSTTTHNTLPQITTLLANTK